MSVLCYNKGCGQRFDPDNNPEDGCTFHPGVPVFHDALKGWSCCKRRTTDFSDFLSIPGCTSGPHNKEKPAEAVKPEVEEKKDGEELRTQESFFYIPKPQEALHRPSSDEPLVRLQQKVSMSLKQALEKLKLSESTAQDEEEDGDHIKPGASCKNHGCSKTFQGPDSDSDVCLFHSGVPIFHEGMKYWSCCKRKTSDFNSFLSQEGCSRGAHLWMGRDQGKKAVPCRFDWHQTGTQVIVSIYARNAIPELSRVDANSTTLNVHVVFEGEKEFEQNITLWGVIDVSRSEVNMMAAKMEISMRKSEPLYWARLDLPPPLPPPTDSQQQEEEEEEDEEEEAGNEDQ